jgi:hypothetical protein
MLLKFEKFFFTFSVLRFRNTFPRLHKEKILQKVKESKTKRNLIRPKKLDFVV